MFTLDSVVPWGRSLDEYRRMFALPDGWERLRILGCGDGPASFNAEATALGARVVSCDPNYQFSAEDLRRRIDDTSVEVLEQTRKNVHEFVWTSIRSIDELGAVRMQAMQTFLADYEQGRAQGRYVDASLPQLPFADRSFDLAVCSHLLFLYTTQLGEAFHLAALRELRRVAAEVRVFPLLALGGQRSPFVDLALEACRAERVPASIETVPYEFQRGGKEMMRMCEIVSW
jgi:SAM-dependent methyltransferase